MQNTHNEKQNKQGFPKAKRSYTEIISHLDNNWKESSADRMKQVVDILGHQYYPQHPIIITGTSGKSTAIHYLVQILQSQGLTVGSFSSPHLKKYNERILINNQMISNESLSKSGDYIFTLLENNKINASSKEILTATALHYFATKKVDVIILEQGTTQKFDPVSIYQPAILAITRLVKPYDTPDDTDIKKILHNISKETFVISSDQSKLFLYELEKQTALKSGSWIMPVRKTPSLPHPYDQIHGKCAALATRVAQIYLDKIITLHSSNLVPNKQTNNNISNILTQDHQTLMYRFEFIEELQKTILLDCASNADAVANLLLGIRLMHYKKPFKHVSFLIGGYQESFNLQKLTKHLRYFVKNSPGDIFLCPVKSNNKDQVGPSIDIDQLIITAQKRNVKNYHHSNFKTAYEHIYKQINDPEHLLVITGSQSIIEEYWNYKKNQDLS